MKKTLLSIVAVTGLALSCAANAQQAKTENGIWKTEYLLTLEQGLHALKAEKYDKALAKLTESAKMGNKEGQYYLAQMYFQGWGTPVNYEEGWLWLNVAMEQKTAEWNRSFRQIRKALPDDYIEALAPYVEEYISKYGADAQDLRCETRSAIGSNIKEVICEKRYY
ncbi:hypothetical protein KUL42_20570 [Alteromonas sp. KUL42]|uniref:sel1 repeat family protein n=1 Tax=Alteromonas sp. KUL42 TaxID=2480797 RepID=UPI000794CB9A|nr:sel1 repeat family protein [Alteromonas sp. KUL42]KXJ59619.1 MAG: hypothetical protein AXW14_15130 [Alteromonas sp. Nap_26]TAP35791.1 sel1 repeat family protein [Alteromonas sp. KUL42]GEA07296.1 hypothetical protein KUL42_20570 [Alteromonas sp. KUL42]